MLTYAEMKLLLQEIGYAYPNFFVPSNETERDGKIEFFRERLGEREFTDVRNGVYKYIDTVSDKYAPTIKQLKQYADIAKRERLNKQGKRTRRIAAPEEDAAHEYIEIHQRAKKRGYFLPEEERQCLGLRKYYEMYYGPHKNENFINHFGKPREEFERLD